MTETERVRIDGVRAVSVPVTDQDRAVEFYGGTLGFETRLDEPLEQLGGRWIEMAPPGNGISIALTPADERAPSGVDTGIRFTTPDAAALHAALQAGGVDVDPLLQWEGTPPMFDFRDPDGNVLYVSQTP
ncbi:extradiol dioxygenase family protein [Stackebrandtia endophytica]|uniref:Extradiol dioxygenase family protein n=1 Tax=Stackebrandtia endophytica TaxID=1496996 RepID=A0A543ASQ9_9ACTN|nr:VOC family protein [Stackebrandtia endophytica]TQL75608.1 extradiol dioxygenase family protein [Stackebrandtia endophytica]